MDETARSVIGDESYADAEEASSSATDEPTLDILKDLHGLYEERLALIERKGNGDTFQVQNGLLRRWVADLAEQNALLARAVEVLEADAVASVRAAHAQRAARDREIIMLTEDLQQREDRIQNLTSQMCREIKVSTVDVDASASLCCSPSQCGDVEPVRDYSALLKEESEKYEAKMTDMEESLKTSVECQRRVLQSNAQLSEEVTTLRRVCCALDEQCRAQSMRAQFKDDIIREMRRQLKQAKAKLKEETAALNSSMELFQGGGGGVGGGSPPALQRAGAGMERGDAGARAPPGPPRGRGRSSDGDGDKISNKSK